MGIYSIYFAKDSISRIEDMCNLIQTQENLIIGSDQLNSRYSFANTRNKVKHLEEVCACLRLEIHRLYSSQLIESGITAEEAEIELATLKKKKITYYNIISFEKIDFKNHKIEIVQLYKNICDRIQQLKAELNSFDLMHQIKTEFDLSEVFQTPLFPELIESCLEDKED